MTSAATRLKSEPKERGNARLSAVIGFSHAENVTILSTRCVCQARRPYGPQLASQALQLGGGLDISVRTCANHCPPMLHHHPLAALNDYTVLSWVACKLNRSLDIPVRTRLDHGPTVLHHVALAAFDHTTLRRRVSAKSIESSAITPDACQNHSGAMLVHRTFATLNDGDLRIRSVRHGNENVRQQKCNKIPHLKPRLGNQQRVTVIQLGLD